MQVSYHSYKRLFVSVEQAVRIAKTAVILAQTLLPSVIWK